MQTSSNLHTNFMACWLDGSPSGDGSTPGRDKVKYRCVVVVVSCWGGGCFWVCVWCFCCCRCVCSVSVVAVTCVCVSFFSCLFWWGGGVLDGTGEEAIVVVFSIVCYWWFI